MAQPAAIAAHAAAAYSRRVVVLVATLLLSSSLFSLGFFASSSGLFSAGAPGAAEAAGGAAAGSAAGAGAGSFSLDMFADDVMTITDNGRGIYTPLRSNGVSVQRQERRI